MNSLLTGNAINLLNSFIFPLKKDRINDQHDIVNKRMNDIGYSIHICSLVGLVVALYHETIFKCIAVQKKNNLDALPGTSD